jgi:hypothetical protein
MTERLGRVARWQTAALLVPGAAALFGGAVAWAAGSAPTSSSPAAPQPTVAPVVNHVGAARDAAYRHRLEAQLAQYHRHARKLRHQLEVIRERTAEVRVAPVVGSAPGYIPPVPTGSGGHAPVVVVVPPPPPVAAPPPVPPPVHTTTGASGHP